MLNISETVQDTDIVTTE